MCYLIEKLNEMKQNIPCIALLFSLFFLINTSQTLARILAPEQGEEESNKLNEITATRGSLVEMKEEDSPNFGNSVEMLMGMGDCHSGDEEENCLRRMMVEEAHLDYIYTQHHQP